MAQHQHMTMTGNLGIAGGGDAARTAIQDLQKRVWALEEAAGIPHGPPTIEIQPVVSGTASPKGTLNCLAGTWNNEPTEFLYQWLHEGSEIADATTADYVVGDGDVGSSIACRVKATNALGSAIAVSNEVAVEPPPAAKAPVAAPSPAPIAAVEKPKAEKVEKPTKHYSWAATKKHKRA